MAVGSDAETVVYHYTDLNAFVSILGNSNIRLTHINFLNDVSEMKRFFEKFEHKLSVRKVELDDDFCKAVNEELFTSHDMSKWFDVYVASFTTLDDELSQWRGYGNGVSLGFDAKKLATLADARKCRFEECIYDIDDVLDNAIDGIIDRYYSLFKAGEFNEDDLSFELFSTAARVKHGKFHEEREVRLIYNQSIIEPIDVELRVKGNQLVPYIEFSLNNGDVVFYALASVMFGPGQNYSMQRKSIHAIKNRAPSSRRVKWLESKVPFRAG